MTKINGRVLEKSPRIVIFLIEISLIIFMTGRCHGSFFQLCKLKFFLNRINIKLPLINISPDKLRSSNSQLREIICS